MSDPEGEMEPRFIADIHLGRLVAYLRLAGFDTVYEPPWDDPALACRSADEDRILLTRDRGGPPVASMRGSMQRL